MGEAQVAANQPAGLRYSSARGRWVLLATVLGSAMASIDATVVGIALPAIGRDFHSSLATLQWVVTAYTLTLAGLLLFAGALGDKYGRKRIFIWGVVWFAVASLLCGIAPDAPVLIAARAVQGIGAALLTPGSLAIIEASFAPDDRGKAIGAWSGLVRRRQRDRPVPGRLADPGGLLAADLRHQPAARGPGRRGRAPARAGVAGTRTRPGRSTSSGGLLVTLGLIGLTYGLIEGPDGGLDQPGTTHRADRRRAPAGRVRLSGKRAAQHR